MQCWGALRCRACTTSTSKSRFATENRPYKRDNPKKRSTAITSLPGSRQRGVECIESNGRGKEGSYRAMPGKRQWGAKETAAAEAAAAVCSGDPEDPPMSVGTVQLVCFKGSLLLGAGLAQGWAQGCGARKSSSRPRVSGARCAPRHAPEYPAAPSFARVLPFQSRSVPHRSVPQSAAHAVSVLCAACLCVRPRFPFRLAPSLYHAETYSRRFAAPCHAPRALHAAEVITLGGQACCTSCRGGRIASP